MDKTKELGNDKSVGEWIYDAVNGDEEAAKVFVSDNAEILHNSNWQDIEKND